MTKQVKLLCIEISVLIEEFAILKFFIPPTCPQYIIDKEKKSVRDLSNGLLFSRWVLDVINLCKYVELYIIFQI